MATDTIDYERDVEIFTTRVAKQRARFNTLVEWHLNLYNATGVELPYNGDETYMNCNVQDSEDWNKIDREATLAKLSKIAKYAASKHLPITKDYNYDFSLEIEIADKDSASGRILIRYNANRETVCTKTIVGTKVIPATTTPEKVEEVVEWECEKIALLAN